STVAPLLRAVRCVKGTEGAEILEFAVSLPLLVVVVVGIFDFGSAFNVKQKIGNAARQGARIASNQSMRDLSSNAGGCTAPGSICLVRDAVANVLTASRLNDCGLAGASATRPAALTWKFATRGTCPGDLIVLIQRSCVLGINCFLRDNLCASTGTT